MQQYVGSFYKEENGGRARADVIKIDDGHMIEYYDARGEFMMAEEHKGKSQRWAEDAAENWVLGIKNLNE